MPAAASPVFIPAGCRRLVTAVSLAVTGFAAPSGAITFRELEETPPPVLLAYKTAGGTPLFLHIFRPPGWTAGQKNPAIVLIHGGAWVAGGADVFYPHARYFASRGMVAISIDYRLLKPDGPPLADCLADCKSAVRFMRTHAEELGIDPRRIAVMGDSAGGHLAAALGTVPGFDDPADDLSVNPAPDAMILCNPICDLTGGSWIKFVIGGNALDKKPAPEALVPTEAQSELARRLSPQDNVKAGLPPTLLMHGLADHIVTPDQAEKFAADMTGSGNRCELVLLDGARHAFIVPKYTASERSVVDHTLRVEGFLKSAGFLNGDPTLIPSDPPAWQGKY